MPPRQATKPHTGLLPAALLPVTRPLRRLRGRRLLPAGGSARSLPPSRCGPASSHVPQHSSQPPRSLLSDNRQPRVPWSPRSATTKRTCSESSKKQPRLSQLGWGPNRGTCGGRNVQIQPRLTYCIGRRPVHHPACGPFPPACLCRHLNNKRYLYNECPAACQTTSWHFLHPTAVKKKKKYNVIKPGDIVGISQPLNTFENRPPPRLNESKPCNAARIE